MTHYMFFHMKHNRPSGPNLKNSQNNLFKEVQIHYIWVFWVPHSIALEKLEEIRLY